MTLILAKDVYNDIFKRLCMLDASFSELLVLFANEDWIRQNLKSLNYTVFETG